MPEHVRRERDWINNQEFLKSLHGIVTSVARIFGQNRLFHQALGFMHLLYTSEEFIAIQTMNINTHYLYTFTLYTIHCIVGWVVQRQAYMKDLLGPQ